MDRAKAFNEFFVDWKKANPPESEPLTRESLALVAAAAAWNAALDWAKKEIEDV
jgi:hypothetical protein